MNGIMTTLTEDELLESLTWSEDSYMYTLAEFIAEFPLPQVVRVERGHDGGTECSTLGYGEVLTLHALRERRVLDAEDRNGNAISVALDLPQDFQILPQTKDCALSSCGVTGLLSLTVKYVEVIQAHYGTKDDVDSCDAGELLEILEVSKPHKPDKAKVKARSVERDRVITLTSSCTAEFRPLLDCKNYKAAELKTHQFGLPVRVRFCDAESPEDSEFQRFITKSPDINVLNEVDHIAVITTTVGSSPDLKFCYEIPENLEIKVSVADGFSTGAKYYTDITNTLNKRFDATKFMVTHRPVAIQRRNMIKQYDYDTMKNFIIDKTSCDIQQERGSPALHPRHHKLTSSVSFDIPPRPSASPPLVPRRKISAPNVDRKVGPAVPPRSRSKSTLEPNASPTPKVQDGIYYNIPVSSPDVQQGTSNHPNVPSPDAPQPSNNHPSVPSPDAPQASNNHPPQSTPKVPKPLVKKPLVKKPLKLPRRQPSTDSPKDLLNEPSPAANLAKILVKDREGKDNTSVASSDVPQAPVLQASNNHPSVLSPEVPLSSTNHPDHPPQTAQKGPKPFVKKPPELPQRQPSIDSPSDPLNKPSPAANLAKILTVASSDVPQTPYQYPVASSNVPYTTNNHPNCPSPDKDNVKSGVKTPKLLPGSQTTPFTALPGKKANELSPKIDGIKIKHRTSMREKENTYQPKLPPKSPGTKRFVANSGHVQPVSTYVQAYPQAAPAVPPKELSRRRRSGTLPMGYKFGEANIYSEPRIINSPAQLNSSSEEEGEIYERIPCVNTRVMQVAPNPRSEGPYRIPAEDQEDPYELVAKIPQDLSGLSVWDVSNILKHLRMATYSERFEDEMIDGNLLKKLDEEALASMQMSKMHRIKLLEFIDGWRPTYHSRQHTG